MRLETTDPSLNAAQLVSKHQAATQKYGCQEIAKQMEAHNITLDDLTVFLGLPTRHEAFQKLKSKLFTNRSVESHKEEEQETQLKEKADGLRQGQSDDTTTNTVGTAVTAAKKAPQKTPAKAKAL